MRRSNERFSERCPHAAASEFDRAIQISPGTGAFYLNRSHLYQRTGRKTQALHDAQRAQSLGVSVDPQYLNSLH
jgi:Tfp pilus assembly protein PilF